MSKITPREIGLCTVWVGDKYGPEYVERLRNGLRRCFGEQHPLFCITEPKRCDAVRALNIEPCLIQTSWQGWWAKIHLANPELSLPQHVVSCDLDSVWLRAPRNWEELVFNHEAVMSPDSIAGLTSSFMALDRRSPFASAVWDGFDYSAAQQKFASDQDYLEHLIWNGNYSIGVFDCAMHYSYKYFVNHEGWRTKSNNEHIRDVPMTEICSLNFHGAPKPSDIVAHPAVWPLANLVVENWR